MGRLMISQC